MTKQSISYKGLEIIVNESNLKINKDNKQVATVYNFFLEDNFQVKDDKIILPFSNRSGILASVQGIGLTKEQYQELLNIKNEIELEIKNYFNNIEKAELQKISGNIYFTNVNKELKKLNEDLYTTLEKEWIKENQKYFVETRETETSETGMNSTKITYTFTKGNEAEVNEEITENKNTEEYQEKQERIKEDNKLYQQLHKLAYKVSSQEFEDRTGRMREDYR